MANLFQARVMELRNQAERLMLAVLAAHSLPTHRDLPDVRGFGVANPPDKRYRHWLRAAGCIGGHGSPALAPRLAAFVALLQEHARTAVGLAKSRKPESWLQELPAIETRLAPMLAEVKRALNSRVSRVALGSLSFVRGPWYVAPTAGPLRLLADGLVRYLAALAEEPRLVAHNPLGLCEHCGGLFLKRKARQRFGSGKCKFAAWAALKGSKYFADKAHRNRQAKQRRDGGQ